MKIEILNTPGIEREIRNPIRIEGIGFHNGSENEIELSDNPDKDGYWVHSVGKSIQVNPETIATEQRTTSVTDTQRIIAMTIEHLFSALSALSVRNVHIEMRKGNEVPIVDGSSDTFAQLLLRNSEKKDVTARKVKLNEPIRVTDTHDASRYVEAIPTEQDHFTIRSRISYGDSRLQPQAFDFQYSEEAYLREISHARTSFPFHIETIEQIRAVRERLKGAIFEGPNRNVNIYSSWCTEVPYYPLNEVSRHKILDFIGDLRVLPADLHPGLQITLSRAGHSIHHLLSKRLFQEMKQHGI